MGFAWGKPHNRGRPLGASWAGRPAKPQFTPHGRSGRPARLEGKPSFACGGAGRLQPAKFTRRRHRWRSTPGFTGCAEL